MPPMLLTPGTNLPPVSLIPVVHLDLQISPRMLSKKFEMVLMGYSVAGGKLIHEKTRSKKSRDTVPLTATQVGDGLLTPTHHSVWPYWIHREQCDGEIVSFCVQVAFGQRLLWTVGVHFHHISHYRCGVVRASDCQCQKP